MAHSHRDKDKYPSKEADRRRDELAKRILNTPPEPRKPLGKSKKNPTGKGKPNN